MSHKADGIHMAASLQPFGKVGRYSARMIPLAQGVTRSGRRAGPSPGVLRTVCLSLTAIASCFPASAATADDVRAKIQDGIVHGFVKNGVDTYLGIPFAAPPVGHLRWQPPQPPAPWTQPLEATSFANHCPQPAIYSGFNTPSTTEDCLYLNVFTPKNTGGRPASGLPVMFWIYGGGYVGGESDDYDASKLAAEGNVIVVTFNYRGGALGFFAHPALTAEHHLVTNYGLMDQQFALQWVHHNIGAFGGNPDNVTLFGESAGGFSIYAHLVSPLVRGLFQRAIIESGAFATFLKTTSASTEASAEASGEAFAAKAGCPDQTAACLRSLPVAQIIANQGTAAFLPTIDGTLLPGSIDTAFSTGNFTRVPIIDGSNLNEFRWIVGLSFDLAGGPATAADYQAFISGSFGTSASRVSEKYPLSNYQSPDLALAAIETDSNVSCSAEIVDDWLATYVPTYAYEFHDPNPPIGQPPISFPWGASHTTELQFLFPLFHGGTGTTHTLSPEEEILSDRMVRYWTDFAWGGNPNSPVAPYWPRYLQQVENVQYLLPPNPTPSLQFAREHKCRFWNSLLGWPESF